MDGTVPLCFTKNTILQQFQSFKKFQNKCILIGVFKVSYTGIKRCNDVKTGYQINDKQRTLALKGSTVMDSTRHTQRYAVLYGVLDSPSYTSEIILPIQPPSSIYDHNLLPLRRYGKLSQVLQITDLPSYSPLWS